MASRPRTPRASKAVQTAAAPMRISLEALGASAHRDAPRKNPWAIIPPAPGVLPSGTTMAMDNLNQDLNSLYNYAQSSYGGSGYGEDHFLGYPHLAELCAKPEYRRMGAIIGAEVVRKWGEVVSTGSGDKSDRIKELNAAVKSFRLKDTFRRVMESDCWFGIGYLHLDTGDSDNPSELATPLSPTPLKMKVGGLKGVRAVDPIWCSPGTYDTQNPLSENFYRPKNYFCMGKTVHRSRLIPIISREVPDLLKPLFYFGGVPLSQIAKPYIENFLRTRTSVSDLIHSFTVFVLSTDLSSTMNGGNGQDLSDRAQIFTNYRDSRGLLIINKETEKLDNVSASLAGLEGLLAQSQEQTASVAGIPLSKLLGVQPEGLNASSDGEMQAFYDTIAAIQEHVLDDPLHMVLQYLMMHLWGEVDVDLQWKWISLEETNEVEQAVIRKSDADTAAVYINAGVISTDEERARLAGEPGSLYGNLDLNLDIGAPDDGDLDVGNPDDGVSDAVHL